MGDMDDFDLLLSKYKEKGDRLEQEDREDLEILAGRRLRQQVEEVERSAEKILEDSAELRPFRSSHLSEEARPLLLEFEKLLHDIKFYTTQLSIDLKRVP